MGYGTLAAAMCDSSARPGHRRETPQPRWSLLYGLAFFTLGALSAVEVSPHPGAGRIALGCGLGIIGFVAMAVWLRVNRVALDLRDWCECAAEKMTVRVIPSRRPEPPALVEPAGEEVSVGHVQHEALAPGRSRGHSSVPRSTTYATVK
jgi:hypothetical protein